MFYDFLHTDLTYFLLGLLLDILSYGLLLSMVSFLPLIILVGICEDCWFLCIMLMLHLVTLLNSLTVFNGCSSGNLGLYLILLWV